MMSLSDDKGADIIDAFNNTSRYLDILIMFIFTIYTLQSSNLIKPIPLILKPHY